MASTILAAVFVLETKGRTNAEELDLRLLVPSDTVELPQRRAGKEGEEGIYTCFNFSQPERRYPLSLVCRLVRTCFPRAWKKIINALW